MVFFRVIGRALANRLAPADPVIPAAASRAPEKSRMTNKKAGLPAIQDKPASGNLFHLWQSRVSGSIRLPAERDSIYSGLFASPGAGFRPVTVLRRHAATLYDFNEGKSPLLYDQPHLAKGAGRPQCALDLADLGAIQSEPILLVFSPIRIRRFELIHAPRPVLTRCRSWRPSQLRRSCRGHRPSLYPPLASLLPVHRPPAAPIDLAIPALSSTIKTLVACKATSRSVSAEQQICHSIT